MLTTKQRLQYLNSQQHASNSEAEEQEQESPSGKESPVYAHLEDERG